MEQLLTLGPFTSDDTGGTFTTYTPDAIGNYTFQMKFAGQTLAKASISRRISQPRPSIGDYFQPSTSNIVYCYSATGTNHICLESLRFQPTTGPDQFTVKTTTGTLISGTWLGLATSTFAATGMYNATGNYNPYTTAPNTAHILWTKPEAFGGIIGGRIRQQ